jgi:hypothetical protein
MIRRFLLNTIILSAVTLLMFLPVYGGEMPEVMFILDASGSMWGKAGDISKNENCWGHQVSLDFQNRKI